MRAQSLRSWIALLFSWRCLHCLPLVVFLFDGVRHLIGWRSARQKLQLSRHEVFLCKVFLVSACICLICSHVQAIEYPDPKEIAPVLSTDVWNDFWGHKFVAQADFVPVTGTVANEMVQYSIIHHYVRSAFKCLVCNVKTWKIFISNFTCMAFYQELSTIMTCHYCMWHFLQGFLLALLAGRCVWRFVPDWLSSTVPLWMNGWVGACTVCR